MERASRGELVNIIENQEKKLQRYESKLKDVVQAYKGLVKEKEALENSFKVLSSAKTTKEDKQASSEKSEVKEDYGDQNKEESNAKAEFSDPLQVHTEQTKPDSTEETQLNTLSESLYTLTQEKSKLEASYVADKKRLIQEKDELQVKLEEEIEKRTHTVKVSESQLQELKARLREQQNEREKEQNDHALMLRELQKLVAEERSKVEVLENKLEDVTEVLKQKEKLLPSMSEVHDKRVKELTAQLQSTKDELHKVKDNAKRPSPQLLSLQRELSELKSQNQMKTQQEQIKATEVETELTALRKEGEDRVSELESKLSQLSDMVGTYERQKVQDQQTIQKLKERVLQLDLENTALAHASQNTDPEKTLDAQNIADRIIELKGQLKEANKTAPQPILIEDLLRDEGEQCLLCSKLREELESSKEEFERYKLRAQSVLKNKSTKDSGTNREMETLKTQVTEMREKIKTLHSQHEEELTRQKHKADSASKTIISLQEKYKQDMLHQSAEHQHQINQLEIEIKKQRERTVSLLSEKDREIEMLRVATPVYDSGYLAHIRNPPDAAASEEMQAKTEGEQAVTRLLKMSSMGQGEANLLFFSQEQARKEVEINSLRRQKHELESALRDLQFSSYSKEESLQEQLENMKEEVRKVERNIAREGANLEYLKNVTYKFLTSVNPKAKQQMLNAITTILQFSPQEKSVVHSQLKGWWTGAS